MTARFLLHLRAWDHAAHHPATSSFSTFDSTLDSTAGGGFVRGSSVAQRTPQRLAVGKRRSLEGGARQYMTGGASGAIYGHGRDVNLEEMELRNAPCAPQVRFLRRLRLLDARNCTCHVNCYNCDFS